MVAPATMNQGLLPFVNLFHLKIHSMTMNETLSWMEKGIQEREPKMICTLNAALLVWSRKDSLLRNTYAAADLVTTDSYVVYYALKLLGTPVPEPLEACQIMFEFIKRNYKKGYRFYLLGAKPEVVQKAVVNLQKDYPGVQIVGFHDGYFGTDGASQMAQAIKEAKPDCLFVGMSSPLKEQFLQKYLSFMEVPISLGVGGGIDILAGKYQWAPARIRKLGLAWFYRLLCEPRRMWKRYLTTNTIFLWLFFKTLIRKGLSWPRHP